MAGIVLDPVNSVEDIERNLKRLNEAIVAMQGGSIAMENIVGYENLATKDDLSDEVKKLQDRHDYQIGDLYLSLDKENPKEKLGYGEWALAANGRTLVGVDTKFLSDGAIDPDYDSDEAFKSPEQTGGEKEHKITVDELPPHEHEKERETIGGALNLPGWKGDYLPWGDSKGGIEKAKSGSAGKGDPLSLLQPYYCIYIWRRTA